MSIKINNSEMKKRNSMDKTTFTLVENATIFFVPFYFGERGLELADIWVKESEKLTDEHEGNAIYPHIMSFLQGQMETEQLSSSHLQVYSIADDNRPIVDKFWKKFASNNHTIEVGNDDNKHTVTFKFVNNQQDILSPHLYIYETAKVGFFSYSIYLDDKNATIEDLKLVNYQLHKIFHPLTPCVANNFALKGDEKEPVRQAKENQIKTAQQLIGDEAFPTWTTRTLYQLFIKEGTLFSPSRMHVFTYCSVNDEINQLEDNDLYADLLQLSRCENSKYMPIQTDEQIKNCVLRTFDNTMICSSLEGTAYIAIIKSENKKFFNIYKGIITQRYLWIYILAVVQRYALMNIDRILTEFVTNNDLPVDQQNEQLWQTLETIQEVKVRCHFTDISPYTQHNHFYSYCCDKLHVNFSYTEIDKKTKNLNLITSHNIQLIHEQEQKQQEQQENKLNLFLAVLAALQAIGIFYELVKAFAIDKNIIAGCIYSALVLIAIIVVVIVYKSIKK